MSTYETVSVGEIAAALPSDAVLTPAEVAELLGLSRPFVARLLEVVVDPQRSFGKPVFAHGVAQVNDVLDRSCAGDAYHRSSGVQE